jgi:hypothetical protein
MEVLHPNDLLTVPFFVESTSPQYWEVLVFGKRIRYFQSHLAKPNPNPKKNDNVR